MNNPILITKYSCIAVLCVVGVLNAAVVTAAPRRPAQVQTSFRASAANAAVMLGSIQGRKGVQDRASGPSRGLTSGSSSASCVAPRVVPTHRSNAVWEECYDLVGTQTYVRLAFENHPLPPGPCPIQVPQPRTGGINHFNITTAVKGAPPDIFNYNAGGARMILDDEHIAIWKQGTTGLTCVSWFESHPGAPASCRWSRCGAPPGAIFNPWGSVQAAQNYFRNALAALGRTLRSQGVQQGLADAIVFTVGVLVVLAAAEAAAGALALFAL